VFTFGGIEGQVASAEAGERLALAVYQQTVLNALRETNDALSGSQRRLEEFNASAGASTRCVNSPAGQAAVRQGRGRLLDVLVAENELFAAELAAVGLQAGRYTQLVTSTRRWRRWVDLAAESAPGRWGRWPRRAGHEAAPTVRTTQAAPCQRPIRTAVHS